MESKKLSLSQGRVQDAITSIENALKIAEMGNTAVLFAVAAGGVDNEGFCETDQELIYKHFEEIQSPVKLYLWVKPQSGERVGYSLLYPSQAHNLNLTRG